MLMRDEKLAQLQTRFDENSGYPTLERDGRMLLRAQLTERAGHNSMEEFFAEFLRDTVNDVPKLVEAPGHTFSDARQKLSSSTYK